jgi:hypothetical protein
MNVGNWGWDPDIPFLGIFVSKFRYFVFAVHVTAYSISSQAFMNRPIFPWANAWGGLYTNIHAHERAYRVRTINNDSFWVKLLSKQLVIEMFVGTHWKAVCLWYKLMLTNCFYSQRQVGKGRNLCSCAKSSARKKKTSQSKPHHFLIWW